MDRALIKRQELAERWNCSTRKVDRLRKSGLLAWIDLTGGRGKKPLVRFQLKQIIDFENNCLMDINANKEMNNG